MHMHVVFDDDRGGDDGNEDIVQYSGPVSVSSAICLT